MKEYLFFMNYKYLFGPVPSRRLGMSLGVDLVYHKVCSLNCVYCECGKTTDLTLERKEYVPFDKVKLELSNYLNKNPHPNYITFSGSGEPTLNSRIGDVINFIKQDFPNLQICLLTNGTLFYRKDVRLEIRKADLVIPSLDAATNTIYRKINRPNSSLKLWKLIYGLAKFKQEYLGNYWLEIFIVPGINDSVVEVENIKRAVELIKPDRVQINSLDRPGAVSTITTASDQDLNRILDILQLENTEIIKSGFKRKENQTYRKDIENTIVELISRRPCTVEDLQNILGFSRPKIKKYLELLESKNRIIKEKQSRGDFYQIVKE